MKRACLVIALLSVVLGLARTASSVEVEPLLQKFKSVGPKGQGHSEAQQAWRRLVEADAGQLPEILAGLDDCGPLGANWIRTAADAIAERAFQQGTALRREALAKYLADQDHHPRGRRLAYEWLLRMDPRAYQRWIPGALDDRSLEMRREAVALLIDRGQQIAKAGQEADAVSVYRRALGSARDLDQIRALADRLKKLGQKPDLARHFGFLVQWRVMGPFDNTDEKGFATEYPPEKELDAGASYQGKHGQVKWLDHATKDAYGKIDLNEALDEEKSVVGYAWTEFISEKAQKVEIRLTSFNAVKLWLNGELIDQHDVYHGGSEFDQYICPVTLRPGPNTILVKVCQNAQTQSWARNWFFQLRICDENGGAILSTDRDG